AVAIGQKSSGAGLAIDPATGQTENLAQIPNIVNSDTDKQLSVIVGIRHNF
ncbi:porin, partial [Desulfobacter hydrogenophilus]|nr:porin [Desulfobacter hydrogenophilus]